MIVFRFRQLENGLIPIDVTLFGMVTEVRAVQSLKAQLLITLTLSGMVTVVIGQCENASSPIVVTLDGITTEVSPVQPSKAKSPISVMFSGITTEARFEQPWNA